MISEAEAQAQLQAVNASYDMARAQTEAALKGAKNDLERGTYAKALQELERLRHDQVSAIIHETMKANLYIYRVVYDGYESAKNAISRMIAAIGSSAAQPMLTDLRQEVTTKQAQVLALLEKKVEEKVSDVESKAGWLLGLGAAVLAGWWWLTKKRG